MHDLDRTLREFEMGIDALEAGEYETTGWGAEYTNGADGEMDELELAATLLEISDDEELEQFFGNLIRKAASGIRSFANSSTGKALTGILKDAAGKALPTVGGAIGGAIGGSAGQKLGRQAGRLAKGALGWEMEQEYEFEVAQGLVRVANEAARLAARAPRTAPAETAAKQAAISAARQVAPALTRLVATSAATSGRGRRSGAWVRRGNTIVLTGV